MKVNILRQCANCRWSCYDYGFIYCTLQDIAVNDEPTDCGDWEEKELNGSGTMADKSDLVQIEEMTKFIEILLNVEKQMQEINDSILHGKGTILKNQIAYNNYADMIAIVSKRFRMQIMTDYQNIMIGEEVKQ